MHAAYPLSEGDLLRPPVTSTAPPQPWNDHLCHVSALYGIHLTFSWGTTLSRAGIGALLNTSKRTFRIIINQGRGDESIPAPWDSIVIPYQGLELTACQVDSDALTYRQVYQATDLLQLCGYDRGYRDEMWAYIWLGERQIGTISIQKGPPDPDTRR
ncbi:MAG: hypothetical protein Q9226_002995 [Calogaya cf. arnoldii]